MNTELFSAVRANLNKPNTDLHPQIWQCRQGNTLDCLQQMESLFWGRLDLGGGGQLGHCYPVIWIGGQCPDNMDSSLMNFPSGEQSAPLQKQFSFKSLLGIFEHPPKLLVVFLK